MRINITVGAIALLILLGGCTDSDWARATSFVDFEPPPVAPAQLRQTEPVTPPQPTPVAMQESKSDGWCHAVSRQEARRNAFDTNTKQEIARQAYAQCLAVFGPQDTR